MPIWLIILIGYYVVSTFYGLAVIIQGWSDRDLHLLDLFPSDYRVGRKEEYKMTVFGSIVVCIIKFILCPMIYIGCFIHLIFYGHL